MEVRKAVKVESSEEHYNVEEFVLQGNEEARCRVERHDTSVVTRVEVGKELRRDGKEG